MNNQFLKQTGGQDYALYLLLLQAIDESIERGGNIDKVTGGLSTVLASPGDAVSKVTAACILHRINLRESSKTRVPELLAYLSTAEKNYVVDRLSDWYLEHRSRPISSLQVIVLRDIAIEQERLRQTTGRGAAVIANAQKRVTDYNETLGGRLFEEGMSNWRFKCVPGSKGLELSLGIGTTRLFLPNHFGLKEPCELLLSAKIRERKPVIGVDPNLRIFFRLTADDLTDIELQRVLLVDRDGERVVCLPLESQY